MINGYSLLTADHRRNSKHGGVCLYFKEHLPLITRNDLSILQECLVTEIIVTWIFFFHTSMKIIQLAQLL